MSSDLRALLAAIVADPGDDTARLAYADCLQEHGNDARASFIRLQIDAERLHPHSNARGALEAQALALFQQHWIEWWDEVCAAVGLKRPMPEPKGRLARFALRAGVRTPPGSPYSATRQSVAVGPGLWVTQSTFDHMASNRHFHGAVFRRGFPDILIIRPGPSELRPLVRDWVPVAPLDNVSADEPQLGAPGPHLAGVRSLFVTGATPDGLGAWLRSSHLPRLVSLDFFPSESSASPQDWSRLLTTPTAARLEWLALRGWLPPLGDLARADLPALRALQIDIHSASWSLRELTDSRFAEQIEQLELCGRLVPDVFRSLGSGNWTALRRLLVRPYRPYDITGPFPQPGYLLDDELVALFAADLPALEDLHIDHLRASRQVLAAMAESPLLKQLKHFICFGLGRPYIPAELALTHPPANLGLLGEAFDPGRLETLTLGLLPNEPVSEMLRAKFGDRVRFLTS